MRAVSLVVSLLVTLACASSSTSPAEGDKFRADDIGVVATALEELWKSRAMPMFVVNETEMFLPAAWKDRAGDVIQPVSQTRTVTISRELIDKYTERNRTSHLIPRDAVPDGVDIITPRESEELMRRNGTPTQQLGGGIVHVSAPAYARSGRRALVSYSVTEGRLSGRAGFVLLRKTAAGWKVEMMVPVLAA
jgi:hypothetical protein